MTVPMGSMAFTNPEKRNTTANAKRRRLTVTFFAISADLFTEVNLDKTKH